MGNGCTTTRNYSKQSYTSSPKKEAAVIESRSDGSEDSEESDNSQKYIGEIRNLSYNGGFVFEVKRIESIKSPEGMHIKRHTAHLDTIQPIVQYQSSLHNRTASTESKFRNKSPPSPIKVPMPKSQFYVSKGADALTTETTNLKNNDSKIISVDNKTINYGLKSSLDNDFYLKSSQSNTLAVSERPKKVKINGKKMVQHPILKHKRHELKKNSDSIAGLDISAISNNVYQSSFTSESFIKELNGNLLKEARSNPNL